MGHEWCVQGSGDDPATDVDGPAKNMEIRQGGLVDPRHHACHVIYGLDPSPYPGGKT